MPNLCRAATPLLLTALLFGAGEARALTIRYAFTGGTGSDPTGGTFEIADLNQPLSTVPLGITVELFNSIASRNEVYQISPNTFIDASLSGLIYQGDPYSIAGQDTDWQLDDYLPASTSPSTPWSALVGNTFTSTNLVSTFIWSGHYTNPFSQILYSSGQFSPASISFSLDGAAVPAPLPVFGAAAAFGWSRRLRRRLSAQRAAAGKT